MFNLSENEFDMLKSKKKSFPVVSSINADELTPINIYYGLKGKNKFLLESAPVEKECGRYTFIGSDPYEIIRSFGDEIIITDKKETRKQKGKVLDYLSSLLQVNYSCQSFDVPFTGGAVGYVGYDAVRQYEDIPDENTDEMKIPETCVMLYRSFICYDHLRHTLSAVYNVLPGDDESFNNILKKLDYLISEAKAKNDLHELQYPKECKKPESNLTKGEFCNIVDKAKKYIAQGDIFQVVLSQRLKFKNDSDPFDVYRRLRSKNPSPYLFYIDFGDYQVAGSSPESLVSVLNGIVATNPIAGTRPRGKDVYEDTKLKEELLSDEKEKAEHVMLVDLGRNDIGKISEFGSVNLDKFMEVDFYSHVMHIVSKVSGKLKEKLTCFDALKSCLPVGTVSGAPKVRAMVIIDELENTKRGLYAGAVGYFSYNGNMDTCIAIRTIIFKDEYAYVQAGAGIVYDSDPESEYTETLNKSMAMREVI